MSESGEPWEPDFDPQVLNAQWLRLFVHGLHVGGIRHVVLSPGSRNTALISGFLRDERFDCHSVYDERSAAFFALGLARGKAETVCLCCTSGSAGAHYLPALIEAYHSSIPLLVVTADRPAELQACGADQTTYQDQLFGRFARTGPVIPEPSTDVDKLRAVMQQAYRAVRLTQYPHAAPAHLNFPLAKPLELAPERTNQEMRLSGWVEQVTNRGPTRISSENHFKGGSSPRARDWLRDFVESSETRAVSLGPCSFSEATAARNWAARHQVPVLSELNQAGRAVPFEMLLTRWIAHPGDAPQRLLHVGPPSVSMRWTDWQRRQTSRLWMAPGPQVRDPASAARFLWLGSIEDLLRMEPMDQQDLQVRGESSPPQTSSAPLQARFVRELEARCVEYERVTASELFASSHLTDARAAYEVLQGVPESAQVLLGNSLPIRNVALVSALLRSPLRYVTTRGVNGIDGAIAAAAGATVARERPTLALLGDVTVAHDLSSLAIARHAEFPLTIIVFDNGGGRIFDRLPVARHYRKDARSWAFWATAPHLDWAAAARTFGVSYAAATQADEVRSVVSSAMSKKGCTLIAIQTEATVFPAFPHLEQP